MMEEASLDIGKPYGQEDYCDSNPDFAVICSFIVQFGDKIDLDLDIEQLKSSLENQNELDDSLLEIHIKLLKKIRRYFVRDQWEKALIRFASEYSYEDAYEIERLGYLKTRPSIKLNLLRRLLDAQFECDQKFKAAVNLCEANELRTAPIGRDIRGNTYWQRSDKEGSLRVFVEEPLNYTIWRTVCKNPEELNKLIEDLDKSKEEKIKGQPLAEPYNPLPEIFPEIFLPNPLAIQDLKNDNSVKEEVSKTKKGRSNKASKKKSSPLPVLRELEEDEEENSNIIELKPDCNAQQSNGKQFMTNGITNHLDPNPNSPDEASVESQVRKTLDYLLTKVASSFDYLIRPLSRNSRESPTPSKEPILESKPKKRQAKKEKPKEELPRRSSSRIQQLQLKKIAEQEEEIKKLVESKLKTPETSRDGTETQINNLKNNKRRSESPEYDLKNGRKKHRRGQSWRRGKGKKKLSWDKDDSDLSSTSSLTDSNDEFEDADETIKYDNGISDDEFACEEEETNIEPVIVKRARTARQSLGGDEGEDLNTSSIHEEDKPCERCDKSNDPEWILLCDMCDEGYHTSCCVPPLMIVPDGDWFCPVCEHKMLLTKLNELYTTIVEIVKVKELERKKRQRLRQTTVKKEPIAIKQEPQESLPEKRERGFLNELNDPLAVQELDEICEVTSNSFKNNDREASKSSRARKAARRPRSYDDYDDEDEEDDEEDYGRLSAGYRKPRKTYSKRNISESDEEFDDESSESSVDIQPKTRRARTSVSYRFQEYDELIKSAIKGESYSDEESSEKASSPEASNCGRGKDMATIEALAYQQENGLLNQDAANNPSANTVTAPPLQPPAADKKKPRKKGRRLNDLDAASETEYATSDESFQASSADEAEAEEDDDDLTEADSYNESDTSIDELVSAVSPWNKKRKKKAKRSNYYSDDSDYEPAPRGRRAAAKAQVSYKESTDEEDVEFGEAKRKVSKKNTLSSGEESHESWKSSPRPIPDSPVHPPFYEDDDEIMNPS